ncbi:PIN domain-containing protein [Burkholderia ambifaria]|uniref:PIN domain-containing protein n=1 Tax=Burkholderia ambifaria TaxID=152480 RepID=UPI00158F0376|nr:PIN domain-containing protein [Burkholderia ambifaria]
MFDTNAIFTKEFDTLISQATKDLVARHSNHGDLSIRWVIPEVVRGEREYQMRNEYRGIASHLTKAERLFGQEWGITQDAVEQRIAACIMAELATQHIDVVPCDIARVDWADIMRRSCFREPPFERGPTEKGFRDAVVCETFIQLASDLVGRDTAVLVSNDRLIKQYIDSYGLRGNAARVIDDLDALHDEIQLRVANVDEDTQVFIEQRAQQLFYPWDNADDPNCFGFESVCTIEFGMSIETKSWMCQLVPSTCPQDTKWRMPASYPKTAPVSTSRQVTTPRQGIGYGFQRRIFTTSR